MSDDHLNDGGNAEQLERIEKMMRPLTDVHPAAIIGGTFIAGAIVIVLVIKLINKNASMRAQAESRRESKIQEEEVIIRAYTADDAAEGDTKEVLEGRDFVESELSAISDQDTEVEEPKGKAESKAEEEEEEEVEVEEIKEVEVLGPVATEEVVVEKEEAAKEEEVAAVVEEKTNLEPTEEKEEEETVEPEEEVGGDPIRDEEEKTEKSDSPQSQGSETHVASSSNGSFEHLEPEEPRGASDFNEDTRQVVETFDRKLESLELEGAEAEEARGNFNLGKEDKMTFHEKAYESLDRNF